jgi:hypothetical protein
VIALSQTLAAGSSLTSGTGLVSPSGVYQGIMQADGNFVVYNKQTGILEWATGTSAYPGSYFKFQSDGNLLVYDSANAFKWLSGTPSTSVSTLQMYGKFYFQLKKIN